MLEAGTVLTFIAELLVPLLYFAPRSGRLVAAAATVMFQVIIFATGNYTFFNLLTIAITVWLLDDRVLSRWVPRGLVALGEAGNAPPSRPWQRSLVMAASAVLVVLSGTQVYEVFRGTVPQPFASVAEALDSLRLTSRYGLFAVMTTTRPEIVFEGSEDGASWREYELSTSLGICGGHRRGSLRTSRDSTGRCGLPRWAILPPTAGWCRWRSASSRAHRLSLACSITHQETTSRPDTCARSYTTTGSPPAANGRHRATGGRGNCSVSMPPLALDNGRLRRVNLPSAP